MGPILGGIFSTEVPPLSNDSGLCQVAIKLGSTGNMFTPATSAWITRKGNEGSLQYDFLFLFSGVDLLSSGQPSVSRQEVDLPTQRASSFLRINLKK